MALSPQEFERLKTQLGAQAKGTAAPQPLGGGFGANVAGDLAQRGSNLNTTLQSPMNPATKGLAILGQGAGFVGDVIGEGIKQIPYAEQALKTVAAPVINSQPAQGIMKGYEEWKAAHPEAATNLESVVNIASLIPATKGAQVVGKTAATGAGSLVTGAGKAVTTAGRATEGVGKELYKTAFTPTAAEAERILSYEAKVPFLTRVTNQLSGAESKAPLTRADTAFEKGIVGTEKMTGVQAKRISDKLWSDKIAPAVEASDAVLTKDELFAPARKLISETVDPTRKKSLQNALDALAEDYAGTDAWDLKTAQALKRDLAKFTPAKLFRGQDVASEVKTLQHEMAGAIRQKTYASIGNKKDYLDYANLSELENIGVKAISESKLKGGFGSFWSAMYDMVTTPVKTIGGRTIYRVGNALEFTGEKGIKKFGDFLKSKGYAKP